MNLNGQELLQKLGRNIRKLRKDIGLTQEQLAYEAEIDRSYMGAIERGERNISLLTLMKIAQCLKVDITELLA